jgi:hypothetical protein
VVSLYGIDDQHVLSASAYAGVRVRGDGRHRWIAQLGPQLVHQWVPSPVDGWDGASDTSFAVHAASGWERRGERVIVRVLGMVVAGPGGVVPWLGASVGVRL